MIEIFPVVHVQDVNQAREQARLAFAHDVSGIYMIQHRGDNRMLFEAYNMVRGDHQDQFVGLNILGSGVPNAYQMIEGECAEMPSGLWVDDVTDRVVDDAAVHDTLGRLRETVAAHPRLSAVKLLGGVSFKYTTRYSDEGEHAAEEARKWQQYVDVVTTSGPGTNREPRPEKLAAIRRVTQKPIAVASGISAHNLYKYRGSIDQVLVASSIETEPYSGEFIPEKIAELVNVAKSVDY